MTQLAHNITPDLKDFTQFDPVRRSTSPAWLDELRRRAVSRFHAVGFPHAKDEDWRHTNITPITRGAFQFAAPGSPELAESLIQKYSFGEEAAVELVFINGHFAPQFSKLGTKVAGVKIIPLSRAIESESDLLGAHLGKYATIESSPFVALNTGALGLQTSGIASDSVTRLLGIVQGLTEGELVLPATDGTIREGAAVRAKAAGRRP